MNRLSIPGRLKEIKTLPNPDARRKALTALAEKLHLAADAEDAEDSATPTSEPELEKKIDAAYKKYVTSLALKIGLLLILLSGVNAIVRSCQPT
ncbi:MAG: hypothetical protein ACE5G9_07230 [Nitrospinales bacterium]